MKYRKLGGINNRNLLYPSSGGWKSEIKVLVELVASEVHEVESVPGLSPRFCCFAGTL